MRIYLVCGYTGRYEDRAEWICHSFASKSKAEELADKLNCALKTHRLYWLNTEYSAYLEANLVPKNPALADLKELDPNIHIDYTGTYYEIRTVEHTP